MSLSYRLTLAGPITTDQLAERAFPDQAERPSGSGPTLSADLNETHGFAVAVRSGRNGYVDAGTDDGDWEWEPDPFAAISFDIDDDIDREQLAVNLVTVVQRVLLSGPEDAAFVINGDYLLIGRFNGQVTKHSHEKWWSYYPAADAMIIG
ncbi:SitI3 family protein [Actinoplanes subglobosus]|uniref:SitI3 family protein n=1 Tax=Actinoplanes subglobosus TaxID=1547892 RepID=A0ABV8IVC1_9ACTN